MQIIQDPNRGKYYIRSYKPGEFLINEEKINNSIILTSNQLINPWSPQSLSQLLPEHFLPIIDFKPEVFLLGTGTKLTFPPNQLLAQLYSHQIGIEIMDTAAACRTYNVLISEGRNVAAGLLI